MVHFILPCINNFIKFNNQDEEAEKIGTTFLRMALECLMSWAICYEDEYFDVYSELKNSGVFFPHEPVYLKLERDEIENLNANVKPSKKINAQEKLNEAERKLQIFEKELKAQSLNGKTLNKSMIKKN